MWLIAFLGVVAVGVPIVCRARLAAVVATALVLALGAGAGALRRIAEDHARRHVADRPPTATTQTFVIVDREE